MTFFARRLNGTPVLSLRTQTGGDINQHLTPDSQSIFHSSMPHVIITDTYEATLASIGDNYYGCTIPSTIAQMHSAQSGKVILCEVEFTNGSKHMLSGMSLGVGSKAGGLIGSQWPSGGQGWSTALGQFQTNIIASADLSLDCGYYTSTAPGTGVEKFRSGTGAKYTIAGQSGDTQRGLSPPGGSVFPPRTDYVVIAGRAVYKNAYTPSYPGTYDPAITLSLSVGDLNHPGIRGKAYDSFYVSAYSPCINNYGYSGPNPLTAGGLVVNGGTAEALKGGRDGANLGVGFFRSNPLSKTYFDNLTDPGGSAYGRNDLVRRALGTLVPRKVTWYVTNLTYNGSGFTINTNLFTGSEIKLSPRDFIVKGVNLMNTSWKFINMIATNAALSNRADIRGVGCNISNSSPTTSASDGYFGVPVATSANAAGVTGGNVSGSNPNVVGIHQFMANASWYVNSQTNELGNQYGPVWSPTSIPLRLYAGSATATLNGNLKFIDANGSTVLATMPLGINATRGGSVICTLEFTGGSWLASAGIGAFNAIEEYNSSNSIDSTLRMDSGNPTQILHQVLCLPVNQYVPIYRVSGYATNINAAPSAVFTATSIWADINSEAGVTGAYAITYWLRALSNGNVEVVVSVSKSSISSLKVQLPNMKLTVQKLA